MHIAIQNDFPLPVDVPDQLFAVVDRRVQELVGHQPFTIEVTSKEGTAIVTVDDAIRIQHWYNFKDEVFTKLVGQRRVRE